MKKNFFTTILFTISFLYSSFAAPFLQTSNPAEKYAGIVSLVVNADVTIVLTGDPEQPARMAGDSVFMKEVTIKQTGDKLVVSAVKNRDWKKRGIIYIPSASLKFIRINNDAYVRTVTTLVVPKLDIEINGSCKIAVVTWGEVNLIGNDSYEYNYRSRTIIQNDSYAREIK